jgi:AraC-like DNA-binding protein
MEISKAPPFMGDEVWKKANYFSCSRKVIGYLEKHFDTPIDLGKMAEVACMEKHAFSKSFKRKTGITPHKFVQFYRVGQATIRMETSDDSITEVALGVGFNSLETFERVFKGVTGSSPSSYRLNALRQNGILTSATNRERLAVRYERDGSSGVRHRRGAPRSGCAVGPLYSSPVRDKGGPDDCPAA